jgi:arylsulfatase
MRFEFANDSGKPGSGGKGAITIDGKKAAEGRIEASKGFIYSAYETADVGQDDATPVTEDYKDRDNKFTGTIANVTIELGN